MMSLNLNWTCYRDKVSFLVKFWLKKIILFKYYAGMKNCEVLVIYIYIYIGQELSTVLRWCFLSSSFKISVIWIFSHGMKVYFLVK